MATIKQIASLAGVSRGTVDRVLNNRGVVNPETAARVREIAQTVHYTPNKVAKTLAIKRRNLKLGFIMFSSTGSNPFFEDVVTGIQSQAEELREYGVTVEIRCSDFGNVPQQCRLMDELVYAGVSGFAITPINHPDIAQKIQQLTSLGIPVVTVNSDISHCGRLAYVGSNYYQSGKTAGGLMRLVTGGNARVGIILGSSEVLCHTERVHAFTESIAKHCPGIKIVATQENHDDDFESFSVTNSMLSEHPEIDALFLAAAGVYGSCRAVEALGLQKKLRIISYDCIPATRKLLQTGTVTATICQQPFQQGAKPLQILFDFLSMDIPPATETHYTNLEIKIRENL